MTNHNFNLDIITINKIIEMALLEDVGSGDITTNFLIDGDLKTNAFLKAKENGIIAGLQITEIVFKKLDQDIKWNQNFNDGDQVNTGDILVNFMGSFKAILTGERTALNFLQRMSGIATSTSNFVQAIKHTKAKILDSRKTAPGLRLIDKYAVNIGGAMNHRIGLFDMVLIKDNHIKIAGGITKAVNKIRSKLDSGIKIEVETSTLEEVEEALLSKVDFIMLDNMPIETMKLAVKSINGKALIEASGNVTLERVKEVAESGVDFISVGALTHSVKALDIAQYIGS